MTQKSLANLGPIMQIAFVPKDFEATIDHWVKKGAGPFFVLKGTKAEYQTCYGKEAYPILDIALGQRLTQSAQASAHQAAICAVDCGAGFSLTGALQ